MLLILARVIGEQFYVRRLARQAGAERDCEWTALLDTTATRLGIHRRIGLLRSPEQLMPITWGIVRRFVMVPAGSSRWPAARREAVLVHELSHVARHDCLTQTLAAAACALYWPHPGIWWAARRLRVNALHWEPDAPRGARTAAKRAIAELERFLQTARH